jgi:hypothetical protein
MPYGRQIAEKEQQQDRCVQIPEGEASRQEVEGFFQEQRIGGHCRNFVEPGPKARLDRVKQC